MYQTFYKYLEEAAEENILKGWLTALPDLITKKLDPSAHGKLLGWLETLDQLPDVDPSKIDLDTGTIQIGSPEDVDHDLEPLLRNFEPWRKGPYDLFGTHIDTEWRSDWKWDRVAPHIQPLKYRLVLDIGCGNGYHCFRMLGAGAERVIGIDPGILSVMQFQAIKHFLPDQPIDVLPLGIEEIPQQSKAFDTVFSMGVLYHRRSPIDHLQELAGCLKPGGELVLETLIIDGEEGQVLLPEDRYAQMRNVWFLPSCPTLQAWLKRCGFTDIKLVDVTQTTVEEQRTTGWMQHYSLSEFLDPLDQNKTCEGLPAPKRAIFVATLL